VSPFQGLGFRKLERHFDFGGSPAVVAVAAPAGHTDGDAVPGLEDVRAFLIGDRPNELSSEEGTWHTLDIRPTRCSSCRATSRPGRIWPGAAPAPAGGS
jgi:hypothetical protein